MEDFQDQRMHCRKNRSKLRPIPKNLTGSKIYRLHQLATSEESRMNQYPICLLCELL